MSAPAISIVVPSYEGGELLEQAVGSCLAERDVELEVVVVDDASGDGTRERLAGLAERDPRVVAVLLDENHGAGAVARNVGLERARGEWVKFLDHDDRLEPGTLARELAVALRERADLVLSGWGMRSIDADGRPIAGTERTYEPPPVDRLIDAIVRREKVPYTGAVLYRREHLDGVRWDPAVTLIDDFDFFCRSALRPGRIARDPGLAYWWQRHDASIRGREGRNPLGFLDSAYVVERIYSRIEALIEARGELTPERRAALAEVHYDGLRAFARFDPPHGRAVLDRIFELDPGFRPTARSERSALRRLGCRLIGVRPTLALYGAARRAVDRVAPVGGWLTFRGERG